MGLEEEWGGEARLDGKKKLDLKKKSWKQEEEKKVGGVGVTGLG